MDLIVGAPWYDHDLAQNTGAVYIFYGSGNPMFNNLNPSQANAKIVGDLDLDNFGWDVADAGDVNDETYDKQNNAILLGIEATKQELNEISASTKKTEPQPEVPPTSIVESTEPEPTTTQEYNVEPEPVIEEETSEQEPSSYELMQGTESVESTESVEQTQLVEDEDSEDIKQEQVLCQEHA